MVKRLLQTAANHSFFLFGARGTGKSTWLQEHFSNIPHLYIDLLDPDEEERLAKDPSALRHQIEALDPAISWIIIDEIQKQPKLLDVVQIGIEKYHKKFAMTGSSARKLKRGAANLLAGRAFMFFLYPMTHLELANQFDLKHALQVGSLPTLLNLSTLQDQHRYLRSYTQTYLKEEITAEQIIRKLDPFRLFLEIAAQQNGEIINYTNIARDVGISTLTVQSYFQILEDTLMGFFLHPYHASIRKRQRSNPKFYFFDLGIKRSLEGTLHIALAENTYGYGKAFEHFVIAEAVRLNSYFEKDYRFSYLRTKDDAEIDLIVERPGRPLALVEIKSGTNVGLHDLRTLRTFKKDIGKNVEAYCFSRDPVRKIADGISMLPWQEGLDALGLLR